MSGEEEPLLQKLENLLETMKDWERKPIIKVGKAVVELVKLPRRETKKSIEPERLVLHIRLEDSFKGVFIPGSLELGDIVTALSNKTVEQIAKALDEINRRRIVEFKL